MQILEGQIKSITLFLISANCNNDDDDDDDDDSSVSTKVVQ